MGETTQEGWPEVLQSMPEGEREAFLKWWSWLHPEVVKQAASGHNWQALIAKAWRAAAKNQNQIDAPSDDSRKGAEKLGD